MRPGGRAARTVLAAAGVWLAAAGCGRGPGRPPEILGVVDDEYLTTDEFLHQFKLRGGAELTGAPREELKALLVAELVDRKLLLARARSLRPRPSREDVHRAFAEASGAGWDAGDKAAAWAVNDELFEQAQIDAVLRLADEDAGEPRADEIARELAAHPDAYARPPAVRLRQIVVRSAATMQRVRDELRGGLPFGEAARRFSEAPERARGGSLGWVGAADLPAELWEAADAAVPGRPVGPVRTAYGWHLLKVEERRPGGPLPRRDALVLARRAVRAARRAEARRAFLAGLRRSATVRLDWAAVAAL